MFSCPHCQFVLTGKTKRQVENGSSSCDIKCNHCEAILRISITTLRDPNYKLLTERGINKAGAPTTTCPKCEATINLGDKNTHKCSE